MSAGWNTIESDAGVFTYLVDNLGVQDVQFEELVSLDAEYLRQRGPVYGVIFLFKYPTGEKAQETPLDGAYDYDASESQFFATQTIQNACGTQALLSVLLNKGESIEIGPRLQEFKDFTGAFPADLRGEALSNSELIRDVHNSFARASPFADEAQRLATEEDDVYHFVAYTSMNGKLYELDGLKLAPISHGSCSPDEFPDKVIPVLQRRIERYPAQEIRFNLMAMVRDLRIRAREVGDQGWLYHEEQKRNAWQWENALRRHNFIGFIGEMLKGVVGTKLHEGDAKYGEWLEEAKTKTKIPNLMARGQTMTLVNTLATSHRRPSSHTPTSQPWPDVESRSTNIVININSNDGSTGRGVLIGLLSAFGSAAFVVLIFAVFYFFRHTSRGKILLDRLGRPGEYDDEQAFAREEAEALEEMDDIQRVEYLRAKSFVQANPPETMQTDISLSQFLAIQEKGVSAWEFEPELEIANCFVEGRTEIEFFDSECSVQSNLPIPKQNEVYYWESKLYDKPESTLVSIGVTTKPYPLFRLPGWHRSSLAYTSLGHRRYNQPFTPSSYGPEYVQGDVIGVGYRPRTGTVFFTRNGKKLDDVAHGLKTQNFFPTVGANGPCTVHVNFGQSGFVFIEANVKKWGLAPMTGSLAPPPPYGSEQGSILLEAGRDNTQMHSGAYHNAVHGRSRSGNIRFNPPNSPGPLRSPTEISLAQLAHIPSNEDIGEGTSRSAEFTAGDLAFNARGLDLGVDDAQDLSAPPPEYSSPSASFDGRSRIDEEDDEGRPLVQSESPSPPIPSYDAAVGDESARRNIHDTPGND
ncbi:MAG: hypothetical protein Q9218_001744 [Villophora microphyllina]